MSSNIYVNCSHSCGDHLFHEPGCYDQTLIQKTMIVVFHILTLGIPFLLYQVYACVVTCIKDIAADNTALQTKAVKSVKDASKKQIVPKIIPDANANNPLLKKLGPDVLLMIGSYLDQNSLMALGKTAKCFKNIVEADVCWLPLLKEFRIWGADAVAKLVRNQQLHKYEMSCNRRTDAYKQIITYRNEIRGLPTNMEYLARLMPGGPVAYMKLPVLDLAAIPGVQFNRDGQPIANVGVEHLTAPVMRGVCQVGHFLAMRVLDERNERGVLIVVDSNMGEVSTLWKGVRINLRNHQNLILHVLQGEALTREECPLGFNPLTCLDVPRG